MTTPAIPWGCTSDSRTRRRAVPKTPRRLQPKGLLADSSSQEPEQSGHVVRRPSSRRFKQVRNIGTSERMSIFAIRLCPRKIDAPKAHRRCRISRVPDYLSQNSILEGFLNLSRQHIICLFLAQKAITCRLTKGLEILDRTGICTEDAQYLARCHRLQRLPRLQHRKRAPQPFGVQENRLLRHAHVRCESRPLTRCNDASSRPVIRRDSSRMCLDEVRHVRHIAGGGTQRLVHIDFAIWVGEYALQHPVIAEHESEPLARGLDPFEGAVRIENERRLDGKLAAPLRARLAPEVAE